MRKPSSRSQQAALISHLSAEVERLANRLEKSFPSLSAAREAAQGVVLVRLLHERFGAAFTRARPLLETQCTAWEWAVFRQAEEFTLPADLGELPREDAAFWRLYEPLLAAGERDRRKRSGVYYTPPAAVTYLVAEASRALQTEFGLADGIASAHSWEQLGLAPPREISAHTPFVRLLDPAAGTGVFLAEAVRQAHQVFSAAQRRQGRSVAQAAAAWSEFAPGLMARITGVELMPAAALLAKLHLVQSLAETGFDFATPAPLQMVCGDALRGPELALLNQPATVLLGNPPYSSLSTSGGAWITRLVRGDATTPGYLFADGERLNERKTWLHDDYVKFIRLAQWRLEQTGCGVLALAVNHGWLDNATFRLMRRSLLKTFSYGRIVDLCGNRKRGDAGPNGTRDENIFAIDQGVALVVLTRSPSGRNANHNWTGEISTAGPKIERIDLLGAKAEKLAALERWAEIPWSSERSTGNCAGQGVVVVPTAPEYRFRGDETTAPPEYAAAWRLDAIFPLHATAPVTARDRFVVATSRAELVDRIREFCDPAISDAELRQRYFSRTRSARYPPGDSRSWKLPAARAAVQADAEWETRIRPVLYRPFDKRWVFWHPALIDWPRRELTQHLRPGNPVLLARRQQLAGQPCNFFFVAEGLVLDGVIRNDNRGGESAFPLYRGGVAEGGPPVANLAAEFSAGFARAYGLRWLDAGGGDLEQSVGPEDLLAYIYALFYAAEYRSRYAPHLVRDFPRVPLVRERRLLAQLVALGGQLARLHLSGGSEATQERPSEAELSAAEAYRIGGHLVCRKWLAVPGRDASAPEFLRLRELLAATIALERQIHAVITAAGGMPGVFIGGS